MYKKDPAVSPKLFDVSQAASYLGVNPGTIRRWAHNGQLKGIKVGIRGDWRFTETELLQMTTSVTSETQQLQIPADQNITNSELIKTPNIPHLEWGDMTSTDHFVQFYENDAFLLDSLSKFIGMGLKENDACIVVATHEHRTRLEARLQSYGIDITEMQMKGYYESLDAQQTLEQFMIDGLPDRKLFFSIIEHVFEKITPKRKQIRVFGEMVALLWAEGNHEAAVQLEALWNDFGALHTYSLFCAYPMHGFGKESHGLHFREINLNHKKVIPTESYTALINPDERYRTIALLQQKAEALEAEIIDRKRIEQQKDEFFAVASHELKTPVTSIKAYTQVLARKMQKKGDSETAEHLQRIDGQLNRLSALIGDLLDITRIDVGKLQFQETTFDSNELVTEICTELQMTTETHTIKKSLKAKTSVFADRARIGQVITNLITNAIKYSPDAKKIHVRTETTEKQTIISVQDFGVGIHQEEQQKIFDRFFRTKSVEGNTFPGMGIGLFISAEIIKRHNGKIWVESEGKRKGSTFFFAIPLHTGN